MKAALITGLNRLEIKEIPTSSVPDCGVLVNMKSAALCGTDIKMIRHGHRDLSLPRIPGHEGVGTIMESRNPKFKSGDVVAVYPGIFCGKCPYCLSGHTARCDSIEILGFNRDGLFRDVIPFANEDLASLKILTGFTDDNIWASLAEPLACCISAYNKVSVKRDNALIVGAGSIGSIFAALLLSKGWKKVLVADKDPGRLNNQVPSGIETLQSESSSIGSALKGFGASHQFDLIVPCCPEGLNWDFWNYMNPGGAAIIFSGNAVGLNKKEIDTNEVHYRELVIAGSYGCNMRDFKEAVRMIEDRVIDLSFLKPYTTSLDDLPECMEKIEDKNIKKIIINRF